MTDVQGLRLETSWPASQVKMGVGFPGRERDEKFTSMDFYYTMTLRVNYSLISGSIRLQLAQVRYRYESYNSCKFHNDRNKLPKSDQFLGRPSPLPQKRILAKIDGSTKFELGPECDGHESKDPCTKGIFKFRPPEVPNFDQNVSTSGSGLCLRFAISSAECIADHLRTKTSGRKLPRVNRKCRKFATENWQLFPCCESHSSLSLIQKRMGHSTEKYFGLLPISLLVQEIQSAKVFRFPNLSPLSCHLQEE